MNKRFLKIILISLLTLIVVGIVVFLIINQGQNTNIDLEQKDPKEEIRQVVSENTAGSNFKITHVSNRYARGEIEESGVIKNIYLIKGDNWKIYSVSIDPISCERATKSGFPIGMTSDCLYQRPNSETPSEINAKSKEEILEQESIEVIGDITFGSDPSAGFSISDSNGESINVDLGSYNPNDDSEFSNQDYVVVDVSVTENEDGEIEYILENIEEIEDGDQDILILDDIDQGTEETIEQYYDITDLPPGEIPDEFYQSLIDRDFSGDDIQIISDF